MSLSTVGFQPHVLSFRPTNPHYHPALYLAVRALKV